MSNIQFKLVKNKLTGIDSPNYRPELHIEKQCAECGKSKLVLIKRLKYMSRSGHASLHQKGIPEKKCRWWDKRPDVKIAMVK